MSLMKMWEKVSNGGVATATVATPATHSPENAPTVARVARVAVASAPKPKTERLVQEAISAKSEIDEIQDWLRRIGRPPEDYLARLILEKCEADPEARRQYLEYIRAPKAPAAIEMTLAEPPTQDGDFISNGLLPVPWTLP